jgi:polyisoprenoid-binding protein YceI
MKPFFRAAFALVVMVATVPAVQAQTDPAPAPTFTLDNAHTSLIFGVSHMGFSYTWGRFNTVAGRFSFDKSSPAAGQFQFEIDAASVDTNSKERDEHLRNPDFFDTVQFPKITFVGKSITVTEKGFDLLGEMTMHGVAKEVTIPMQFMGEGESQMGYHMGFTSQFFLKRSDFGMTYGLPAVGDEISIMFSFEGMRDTAGQGAGGQ